jgi:hypothetical protein
MEKASNNLARGRTFQQAPEAVGVSPATDTALVTLGFIQHPDVTLSAPPNSATLLVPVFELRISQGAGNSVTAVLAKAALKVSRK